MTNLTIINELAKVAKIHKSSNNFKYRAYLNAINTIDQLEFNITNIDQLNNLKGIGKGIRKKIEDILIYGKIMDEISHRQDIINLFMNIYGVGEKKAKELYDKNGIEDLQTLKDNQYVLLNEKQRIGLKYYHPLLKRIPKKEINVHKKMISKLWMNDLNNIPKLFKFEIVGSYRRESETSGDIDILITYDEHLCLMPKLIDELLRANYMIEILAEGEKKFMGICKLPNLSPRRIDILWTSPSEYPFALLYFTGNDNYNRNMREFANKKGYKLNEKRLISLHNKKVPIFKSEEEICNFLGLPYLHPSQRNGPLFLQK